MLWPGQFVTAVLTLDTIQNADVIPAVAVQTGQQGPFVFVVKPNNTVEIRPVTVGRTFGDKVVIETGVAAWRDRGDRRPIGIVPRRYRSRR